MSRCELAATPPPAASASRRRGRHATDFAMLHCIRTAKSTISGYCELPTASLINRTRSATRRRRAARCAFPLRVGSSVRSKYFGKVREVALTARECRAGSTAAGGAAPARLRAATAPPTTSCACAQCNKKASTHADRTARRVNVLSMYLQVY
ncbi:hypothetical protein EVAR_49588_1 [Eumeta japonica]|uniref:Uncharacterized protein n=1 Tax=Eumeta variegata TaxID=151549 RepID=A0A4C1ZWX8_EUMVA|nr:hypothetical protein EVAR_49588_1 [Eumeta japonica]